MLDIFIDSIEDNNTRDVLRRLLELLDQYPFVKGKWAFLEISVASAVTNQKYPHNLGFRPKDAIITSFTDGATVTLNRSRFDETNIDFTTSGAADIRMIVGSYSEDQ